MSINVPFVSETILGTRLTEDDGFAVPSSAHFDKVEFEIGMDEARVQPPAPKKPCLFFQSIQEFHHFSRLNPPVSVGENISITAVILQPTSPGFFKLYAQPTEVLVPAGLGMFLHGYPYANIFDPYVFCGGDSGLPKEFPQAAPHPSQPTQPAQPAQPTPQPQAAPQPQPAKAASPAPQPAKAASPAPQTQKAHAPLNVPSQDSRDTTLTSEHPQKSAQKSAQELVRFHGPSTSLVTSLSGSPKEAHPPQPSKRALKQRAKRRARQESKKQRRANHKEKAQKEAMMAEAAELKAAQRAAQKDAQKESSQVAFSHYHHSQRLARFFEHLPLFLEERRYRLVALPQEPRRLPELPIVELPLEVFPCLSVCAGDEKAVSSRPPKRSAWCGLLKTRRKTKAKKTRPTRRSGTSWV